MAKNKPAPTDDEDELDAQIDAALNEAPTQAQVEQESSAREAAALEEKLQAERIATARAASEAAEKGGEAQPEENEEALVSVAAKGREYLMQKLREHAEKPKPVYVPPPMTERMRANIEAEMEAGRRTQARHEAQQASRPVPPKEPWDGTNTVVFRPGTNVPDPTVPAPSGYVAGSGTYDPKA
jgi:hypothetical protein